MALTRSAVNTTLQNFLSDAELQSIPNEVCTKLHQAFQDQLDENSCFQSLLEAEKQKNDSTSAELKSVIESTKNELAEIQEKYVSLSEESKGFKSQLESVEEKYNEVESVKRSLEKSIDELRHQRDTSTFNANSLQSQLDFKETQFNQQKADLEHLRSELEKSTQEKFKALVNQDEVEIKSKELELKEAQLDKDKQRMQKQIDILNVELDRSNNEILQYRKEMDKTICHLQTQLEHKTCELNTLKVNQERLQTLYNEREKEATELRDKLTGQAQDEIDYRVHLEAQLNAQKAFAQAHQEAFESAKVKCSVMEKTIVELKEKLDETNAKHASLEVENEDLKKELEVRVEHFNEQMRAADEMLFAAKTENLDKTLEHLSPYAALVSKKLREGLTFTDIMKLYADAQEELVTKQSIIDNIQIDMNRIMDELREVAPKMRQKSERLHQAMTVIDHITIEKEKLENDKSCIQNQFDELKTKFETTKRENERSKGHVKDLSKQLCLFLKKEAEERGIPVPITTDQCPKTNKRASLDLNSLVENRLLTFSCIEELQQRNLELLESIRVCEKELQNKDASLHQMEKQQSICEDKLEVEKQLEQLKAQYETQRQHMKYLMIILRQRDSDDFEYNEDFQSFASKTRVTVEVQTDQTTLQYSTKDYEELNDKFKTQQVKYEKQINELRQIESKLREEIRSIETITNELKVNIRKTVAENEYKEEMITTLRHNAELKTGQVETLEKTCQSYRESLFKTETQAASLREALSNMMKTNSTFEIERNTYKREVDTLNEKLRDLNSEREIFLREKNMHSQLLSQIEGIKNQMQLSDSIGKAKIESKLEDSMKEVNGLRHKLQEEQSLYTSKVEMLNKNIELLRKQIQEEIELKNKSRNELEKIQNEAKLLENDNAEMKQKLEEANKRTMSSSEHDKKVEQLQYEMVKLKAELEDSKKMVTVTKQNEKSIQEICATFEKHNRDLTTQNKILQTTYDAKINALTNKVNTLTNQLREKEQQSVPVTASPFKSQAMTGVTIDSDDVLQLRKQLEEALQQLRQCEEEKEKALSNYSRELKLHAEDSQELPKLKVLLSELKTKVLNLENEKFTIQNKLNMYEKEITNRKENIEIEKLKVKEELEQLKKHNEHLYQALNELSDKTNQSLNEIENASFGEEELKGNDNVISVIKYLRQQTSLAKIDKQNRECENKVLKNDLDMMKRRLGESNELLNAERNKNLINEKTLEKHSELIKKIEMMELVSDSNRILREDREKLQEQLDNINKEKEAFEQKMVEPLKTKINQLVQDLEMRNQQVEHLKKQSDMWKKRSDELLDKSNRSNPEDIKRLTLEKETLSKQLMNERESYRINLEELKTLRADNSNLHEEVKQLQLKLSELKKSKEELTQVKIELEKLKSRVQQLSNVETELDTLRKDHANISTQLEQKSKDTVAKDTEIANLKQKEAQIRTIARKYRTQFEETRNQLLEKTKETTSKEEEDKQRNESHETVLKEKIEQITNYEAQIASLSEEINVLKQTYTQKEDRMKEVLRKCKSKMATQVIEISQLKKQASGGAPGGTTASLTTQPTATPSAEFEELEKTITELREENEKLTRDVEQLQQKTTLLTRHYSAQTPKPSTSSSSDNLGVKITPIEPPTANIKPMAGTSTTSVKHPATTQQSVTIMPFRETPFASIRPMFLECRTVVVPPTTAVVPQAQVDPLEPSSSHTDYMPATSSAVRQATVLPTTQPPRDTAAESTQDEEVESPAESEQTTGQQPSIALVLPQERQDSVLQQPQQSQQPEHQLVTASNQDEAATSHSSQQYRQEVPSTSTSQQVNDNSSNTVTTSRAEIKRGRTEALDALEEDEEDPDGSHVSKRRRVLEVEYQVPTSSQRDQEDDVLQDSDDEDEEQEGVEVDEGGEADHHLEQEEEPDDGGVEIEEQDFDEGEGDVYEVEEQEGEVGEYDEQNTQPNASEPSSSQPPPYGEGVDDSIVPSTPTLFVPRRTDAVSSPHVPSGRFTFSDSTPGFSTGPVQGGTENLDTSQMIDLTTEEAGTSRSVPTTPVATEIYVDQVVAMRPSPFISDTIDPNFSHDPNQDSATRNEDFELIDIEGQSEVSSEGERQERPSGATGDVEEGREAEAVAQRIPLVTPHLRGVTITRTNNVRGSRSRGGRIAPISIVWEDPENPQGAGSIIGRAIPSTDALRGFRGRGNRRGRPFPSFNNRYLP